MLIDLLRKSVEGAPGKRLSLLSVLTAFLLASGQLHANVSRLFLPSITNQATGGFINDTWDYISTPYLYSHLDSGAISLLYVGGNSSESASEGYHIGFQTSLWLPWHVAIGLENNKASNINREFSTTTEEGNEIAGTRGQVRAEEREDQQIKLMVGTRLPEANIGLYLQQSNRQTETEFLRTTGEETDVEISEAINSREQLELFQNSFGLEVGNSSRSLSWAWSFSLDLRDFSSDFSDQSEGETSTNDAPIMDFYVDDDSGVGSTYEDNPVADSLEKFSGDPGQGFSREEIGIHFLGWIPMSGNLGLDLQAYIPSGSGANGISGGGRNAELSGYNLQPTFFFDKDFAIDEQLGSAIRFTPAVAVGLHQEKIEVDAAESGDAAEDDALTFEISENEVELQFGIKLIHFIDESLALYFSYLPSISLYHIREESASHIEDPADRTNTISHAPLSTDLGSYSLGFSYKPNERLSLHGQFDTQDSESEFVLSDLRLGLDFHLTE